jgi:proteasome lid subunit RPN8/RPN11
MNVQITSDLLATLQTLANKAFPEEACGLLLGRPDAIIDLRPARNVADEPRRRFEIDPAMLLATHREARGLGLEVIGHYHSHPNGRAAPSRRDAARALDNGQLWLIVTADTVSAWRAVAEDMVDCLYGRFRSVNLEVR